MVNSIPEGCDSVSESSPRPLDELELLNTLSILSFRVSRVRDSLLSKRGVGGIEIAAHGLLLRLSEGSLRVSELAELLYSDPSTISRQVKQLVEMGLVSKEVDPHDGRGVILQVTILGKEKAEETAEVRRKYGRALLEGWTEEEKRSFIHLYLRFAESSERIANATK